MSLVRLLTLVLCVAAFAPSLGRSELAARQSDDTDALDTAWTVIKDLGMSAIECPLDCSSFLLSMARCSGRIATQISITAGLECICEDVPTGLDKCSACTSSRDSTEATSGGTALASDWIDSVCGIIGMERSSSLDDSSTSTATTAAPQTFTGVDSTNEARTTSFVTNGVPVDNVIPLESRISYLSVASASSASFVSIVSAASASAAAAALASAAAAPSSTTTSAPAQASAVTVTAPSSSVDSVSAALASASAVLASASSAAAAAAESAKEGGSSGATSGRAQLSSLVGAGVVVAGALAAW